MSLVYLMYAGLVIIPLYLLLYFTLWGLPKKKASLISTVQILVVMWAHYLDGVFLFIAIIVFPLLNIFLRKKLKKK